MTISFLMFCLYLGRYSGKFNEITKSVNFTGDHFKNIKYMQGCKWSELT